MATIKDVAQRAGVSISTVSRVLNGTADVKESKVRAVEEAIEYYKYQPSQLGRGLVTGRTKIIGIYSPFERGQLNMLYSDYLLECLRGVDEVICQSQYSLLLLNEQVQLNEADIVMPKFGEYVSQKRIDGLIIAAGCENKKIRTVLRDMLDMDFPVAHFGKWFHEKAINIYASYSNYMQDAILQLYKQGHRNVIIGVGNHRRSLFEEIKRCSEADFEGLSLALKYGDRENLSVESIEHFLKTEIVQLHYTAVIWEDLDSVSKVITALNILGCKVPEDVSIISVEHIRGRGSQLLPKINAYYVPAHEMGRDLAKRLLKRLEGEILVGESSQIIYPEYIERDSVICIPGR